MFISLFNMCHVKNKNDKLRANHFVRRIAMLLLLLLPLPLLLKSFLHFTLFFCLFLVKFNVELNMYTDRRLLLF